MATVIVSSDSVLRFPQGGGHFWVYMQYIHALRRAGCDVYWMERLRRGSDPAWDEWALSAFLERTRDFGLAGRVLLYEADDDGRAVRWLGGSRAAEATLRRADLLLNFHYELHPSLLELPQRTALVDIDPGLLQVWMSAGQLAVHPHDTYLTIGETVGTPTARFPDCGVTWTHITPPVCLDLWQYSHDAACKAFTTVASWWSGLWVRVVEDGREDLYDNRKRAAFLPLLELPRHTRQPLELALLLADCDAADRCKLEDSGWRIRDSRDVAGTPAKYQQYVRQSRGELSAAKPSCIRLQNAWVSDRTVCYLASGKPVVVQDTGPSTFLRHGEGMFRFKTVAEAAAALEAVNADYERHCRAARDIAEAYFDANRVIERILEVTLA